MKNYTRLDYGELEQVVDMDESVFTVFSQMQAMTPFAVQCDMPLLSNERDPSTGVRYAKIAVPGSSATEAIALHSPFANRTTEHHLISADFVRRVLVEAGIRDDTGAELPVFVFSAPTRGSGYKLPYAKKREMLVSGDLTAAAALPADIIRRRGFGKIAVAGHSYGGVMALATPKAAYDLGLDTSVVASSDPVCSKEFGGLLAGRKELGEAFAGDSTHLRTEVEAARFAPYTEAIGFASGSAPIRQHLADAIYMVNAATHPYENWVLTGVMARNSFKRLLSSAAQHSPSVVVGHGTMDQLLAPVEEVDATMTQVATDNPDTNLMLIQADWRHTWADNLAKRAQFCLEAFRRDATVIG